MRAAIYDGQRAIRLTELEIPRCGDHDIVVRNLYASICGTDVAVYLHGPNTGHRVERASHVDEALNVIIRYGADRCYNHRMCSHRCAETE